MAPRLSNTNIKYKPYQVINSLFIISMVGIGEIVHEKDAPEHPLTIDQTSSNCDKYIKWVEKWCLAWVYV